MRALFFHISVFPMMDEVPNNMPHFGPVFKILRTKMVRAEGGEKAEYRHSGASRSLKMSIVPPFYCRWHSFHIAGPLHSLVDPPSRTSTIASRVLLGFVAASESLHCKVRLGGV